MSYIFRLHKQGVGNCSGWQGDATTKYSSKVMEEMAESSPKSEITSIPSPFARIDLLKTAFKKVLKLGIDGDSIHHKMVSDCFDVGQIFFNMDKYKNKIEIICWDKENDLQELLNSSHPEHQQLGRTYDLYLKQDGKAYNFDKMQQMYFLNFIEGPAKINIIGATSPATLFFTSANDLSYVSDVICFGNDHSFDKNYCPLYRRDLEYQKYWYLLQKKYKEFPELFKEVNEYLNENFKKLAPKEQAAIRALNASDMDGNEYADITVNDAEHTVQVIEGLTLKKWIQKPVDIQNKSGFVIDSPYTINDLAPLVLPVNTYTYPTIYVKDKWDKDTRVPYCDPRPLQERTLPKDESKYPYLTIGDFLEDTIVRMPYKVNSESFFDGNLPKSGDEKGKNFGFLLPLTDLFFQFFTVEQLQGLLKDGKKMFELEDNAAGITVILRIPIQNNASITYRRTYFEGVLADPEYNDGYLMNKTFGLGIMPLVRFPEKVNKRYRIALFDLDTKSTGVRNIKLTCFDGNRSIAEQAHCIRDKKDMENAKSSIEAYAVHDNFDRISVQVGNVKGALIPKFSTHHARKQFTFAIDFGTTNTHIEYSLDQSSPETFNILANERQLHKLHSTFFNPDIEAAFDHNFIPDLIAENTQYTFPMRTAFAEYSGIDYDKTPYALVDGNVPFLYEKDAFPKYNELKTGLKWNAVPNKLVRLYLENLFLLMRNKVLLNDGNLEATKIIWFYPASMDEGRVNRFNSIWNSLYGEYFGGEANANVISISESAAPYQYYSRTQGAQREVVTIDVGGSTTDVYVVEDRLPKMLLSFRFASEALFGDAYNWNSDNNGFVRQYKDQFARVLRANGLEKLESVLKEIERKKKSPDIVAFFFSLIGNKEVNGNEALNFLEQLSANDRLRYVFTVFYGAILYFIAKSMKAKQLKKPLTLAFSGNGSKTLYALSGDVEMIARFAKLIFDGVYNDNSGKLTVIMEENPKKATCKGGILEPVKQAYDSIEGIKYTFIGDHFDYYANQTIKYSELTNEIKENVVKQVSEFVEFLFKLHEDNNNFFTNKLTAESSILRKVKEICIDKIELEQSLKDGLDWKQKSLEDDEAISETLFFYPLVGVLHEMARKV
ncbi:MAG: hypothetical protein FWF52_08360 [Candidatus Azobacteroides sp.]|nr:hypothetical protein [Candidatus Azobacteroides sp.]